MIKRVVSAFLAICLLLGMGSFISDIPSVLNPTDTAYAALNTSGNSTTNLLDWGVVPAPGEVVIDGIIGEDEWDWSNRLIGMPDYTNPLYKVEVASMWDKDNFYMAFKYTDPSPMVGNYDPILEPSWTWRDDSVQLRTYNTDRNRGWWTISYYGKNDMGSLYLTYPDENDSVGYTTLPGSSKLDQITFQSGQPQNICLDAEVKYRKWDDGTGYSMELKIPWQMMWLGGSSVIEAGKKWNFGIECYWGDPYNASNNENKIMLQGGGYTNTLGWKGIELLAAGNVTPREYIFDAEDSVPGTIAIPVKVPKSAKRITLVVEDGHGNRISNAVNEWEITENCIIGEEGDYNIVETLWDGKDYYGTMVNPGEYTIKGIYHDGITPYFDATFYNPGNPPWPTQSGVGSWASDHHAPEAVAAWGDNVVIGSANCESGTGVFMVDNDGTKLWGIKRGAIMLATNDKYVYCLPGQDFYASVANNNAYLMRLDATNGNFAPFIDEDGNQRDLQYYMSDILGIGSSLVQPSQVGLAANNEYIALATANDNQYDVAIKNKTSGGFLRYGEYVNILDAETGTLLRKIAVDDVGRVAFDEKGNLFAISGSKVVKINPTTGVVTSLPIKAEGNEEFTNIAIDKEDNVVIYDRYDRQLKVYNQSGKKLYEIGQKGGRDLVGYWQEDQGFTHQVMGITVDDRNQIWVAEYWNAPRRVSVWTKDGFVKDFIGNPGYMAASTWLHDQDAEKGIVGPVECEIDRETNTWKVTRILWVPDLDKGQTFPINANDTGNMRFFRTDVGGVEREFMFQSSGGCAVLYTEMEDGSFQPCWATGVVSSFANVESNGYGQYITPLDMDYYRSDYSLVPRDVFKDFVSAVMGTTMYVWNDWDNDGAIEVSECEFRQGDYADFPIQNHWGSIITKNLEFMLTDNDVQYYRNSKAAYIVSPDYFRDGGIPVYTFGSWKLVETENNVYWGDTFLTDGGTMITIKMDGGSINREAPDYQGGIRGIDPETGKDLWWYANRYPGVHGAQGSSASATGLVIGPIKTLGTFTTETGKEVFVCRGYLGEDFAMTTDGYFIQHVFIDGRIEVKKLPDTLEEALGMDMSGYSESGEPWGGYLTKHDDGVVRSTFSGSGPTGVVVRWEGFDTIHDIEPFKFTVTKAMIDEAREFNFKPTQDGYSLGSDDAAKEYAIAKVTDEITINGESSDWFGVGSALGIAVSGVSETANAILAYDDNNLYALFVVENDETPMANLGQDYGQLFVTGDACDIFLSDTASTGATPKNGDMRITLSTYLGKPVAVLTEPESDKASKPYMYSSPVSTSNYDHVAVIDDAEVAIVRDTENNMYIVEAKIPFSSLGINVKEGKKITGEVGLIVSDQTGINRLTRMKHFLGNTEMTYDIPTEARLTPSDWGKMYFAAAETETDAE